MSAPQETKRRPGAFWRALGVLLKALVRLTLVLLVGVLVGAGIYYGVQWTYYTTILPIQQHTRQIERLQGQIDALETQQRDQTADLQRRLADLEGEVTALGETDATHTQALAEIEQGLADLKSFEPRLTDLTATIDAQATEITRLQRTLRSLAERLSEQENALAIQTEALSALEESLNTQLASLSTDLEQTSNTQVNLDARLALAQAAHDLLVARIAMLEDNVGNAREAIALAQDHVRQAAALNPALTEELTTLQPRLQALDELVAQRAFRAVPTLDSLWADIVDLSMRPSVTIETTLPATSTVTTTAAITVTVVPTSTVSP